MRSVHHPAQERVLWIGAHPDDEAFVAPILGRKCLENGADCTLLVVTQGENGDCLLPEGCGGDLGSIRAAEMSRAAAMLNASLTLWGFSDVGGDVDSVWSAEAGGHDAFVNRIASVIAAVSPTVIYTFDPNHGSTCHPAHRAVGALVLEAANRTATPVALVETAVEFLPDDFVFRSATPEATSIDATSSWHYLVEDIEVHASQFTHGQREALRNTPAEQRRVYLATVPAQKYSCGR